MREFGVLLVLVDMASCHDVKVIAESYLGIFSINDSHHENLF